DVVVVLEVEHPGADLPAGLVVADYGDARARVAPDAQGLAREVDRRAANGIAAARKAPLGLLGEGGPLAGRMQPPADPVLVAGEPVGRHDGRLDERGLLGLRARHGKLGRVALPDPEGSVFEAPGLAGDRN